MARSGQTAALPSELNAFLFAPVGTEANGMTLSLLSLFARNGSDPWVEARHLADLPRAEASDRLARAIAAVPHGLAKLPDAVAVAERLIALLPAPPVSGTAMKARVAIAWPPSPRSILILAGLALCVAVAIEML